MRGLDSAHVGTVGDVIPNLMFRVLLDEHRPSFGERAVLVVTVFESLANDDWRNVKCVPNPVHKV